MKKLLLVFVVLMGTVAYGQIPTGNLLGEYKFINGTLNTSVGSQHFTRTGSAMTIVPNRAGGPNEAINLNGDHLQRAGSESNSLTVSFWIKTSTNDVNKRVIIDQSERVAEAEGAAEVGWYAYLKDGKIGVGANFQWYHNNSTVNGATGYLGWHQAVAPTVISDGNWHHVAVSITSFAGNWYNAPFQRTDRIIQNTYVLTIDNVIRLTQENTRNVGTATNPQMRRFISLPVPITVANSKGGNSTNRFLEAIDDIRYYSAVLTPVQVTALATEVACAGSTGVTALTKNITVQLDATGNATITAAAINNGSVNTCGVPAAISIDVTSFTCDDLGANTVTLTATDGAYTDDATATVTVTQLLTVTTINTLLILPLNASGNATLTPAAINNGSTTSCGPGGLTMSLNRTAFTCIDAGTTFTVTLTVTDGQGNSGTGTAFVKVEDTIVPTAVAQNISVQLDVATGLAVITPSMVNNGSTDNCTFDLFLSKTTFSCEDIGGNVVVLTARDARANNGTATATVTVTSAIANETVTTTNAEFCTDGTSGATISTGSSVVGVDYFLRNSANNAVVAGPTPGTGSALNFQTGNLSQTTTFNVYAESGDNAVHNALDFDGVNDKVTTPYTISLTNELTIEAWLYPRSTNYDRLISNFRGTSSVQPGEFILDSYNSTDNGRGLRFILAGSAGVAHTTTVGNVLTLNAWNHVAVTFESGVVKLIVNGIQVGTSTAPFTSIPGSAYQLHLGEDRIPGNAEYFNGKMDEVRFWSVARNAVEISAAMNNCLTGAEPGLELYYTFDETGGTNVPDQANSHTGALSNMDPATDWTSGADVSCSSLCSLQMSTQITIGDSSDPTANTKDITVQLDGTGNALITAAGVNDGSTDNCTPAIGLLLSLSKSTFTCDDLGVHTVTLTVEDASGNEATATATVTVEDNIAPTALVKNIEVILNASGNATLAAADIDNGSSDNCTAGVDLVRSVSVTSFTQVNEGPNNVTLTVEDASGNTSTATAIVTVVAKTAQTITFNAIPNRSYIDGGFSLTATATSGLAVSYSIVSGPATISGSSLNPSGAGTVIVKATQAGNADYLAAPAVQQTFVINPASVTITAANKTITYGDNLPVLTYTFMGFIDGESSSVLTAQPTITTAATVNSDAGTYPITLSGGTAANYVFTRVDGVLTINKADQVVSIQAVANKTITDAAFSISASTTSGLALTYTITGPATISGAEITLNGTVGTVTVTASQAGNINFTQATATTSFEVIDPRQAQTITFAVIAGHAIETGQITLAATASSGLPVTFEVVSGPATLSSNTISFNEVGTVVIRAKQDGNGAFQPAVSVERSFEVFSITGVEEISGGLRFYPNPATDYLQVEIPGGEEAEFHISTMDGRKMMSEVNSTGRIDISSLSSGLYIMKVAIAGRVAAIEKIIKN